jgi:uncharacterized membrane protein YhaH (DUF805 family)
MQAHITGSGKRDRRLKGRNNRPKYYLAVEILLLALIVFFISFLKIKLLTIASALAAIFVIIMSCIPRYRRIVARQTALKVHNYTRK